MPFRKVIEEGNATYTPIDGKYKITNRKLSIHYDPIHYIFPRMWSSDNEHVNVYMEWAGLKESRLYEPRRDASEQCGAG